MGNRIVTIVLLVGIVMGAGFLGPKLRAYRGLGNHQGYEPAQPIAFSHRLHAGELSVPCLYCHSAAERSRHAGIPAASLCMNCHTFVTAPLGAIRAEEERATREGFEPRRIVSAELAKLYGALALNADRKEDPQKSPSPIEWTRVHNLPDFVQFHHGVHVTAGVACQKCHGPVETMERMRQVETLSMGWCVDCHRQANKTGVQERTGRASRDCVTCHF